jgi:hypothetical protein
MYINGNLVDQTEFRVGGGGFFSGGGGGELNLGQVVATNRVTEDGCPRGQTTQFFGDETIYLSMNESYIPAGTEAFARLYHEGRLVEETDFVRADRDMETCLWFAFEPDSFNGVFDPGRYDAELYIDNDVVQTVRFEVE